MKNKKVILSSILSLVLCLSLIAGGTFALFTSEAKTNIAITSGKVEVKAIIENLKMYSLNHIDQITFDGEEMDRTADGSFLLGGTATINNGALTLTNIMPGDRVEFDVNIENSSNVAVKYRTLIATENDTGLYAGLTTEFDKAFGEWETLESTGATIHGKIGLPASSGNTYSDKSVTLIIMVEAVQGNAVVHNNVEAASQDEMNSAIKNATTPIEVKLSEGTYTVPTDGSMKGKDVVFSGTKDTVIDLNNVNTDQSTSQAEITFDGVTVKFGTDNYKGLAHTKKVVYNDCIIEGKQFLYAPSVDFINCTFKNSADYCVWTYGARDVSFTDCTFYSGGKAILVYNEETASSFVANINVSGCTFIDDGTLNTVKAAIETGSNALGEGSNTYNITVTDSIVAGFAVNDEAEVSNGTTVWGNKNNMTAEHLKVTVTDTEEVEFAAGALAIITAEDMFAFASDVNVNGNTYAGKSVVLLKDIDLENKPWTPIGQTGQPGQFMGTFDGRNHTIKNLNINAGDNVVMANGENVYSVGLFGWLEQGGPVVKNLIVDGATVVGHHNVAVIAGYAYGTIENCHVKNATLTNTMKDTADGDKTGLIVGYLGEDATLKNCTGADSQISTGRDGGQIVGAARQACVSGCSATNVTVTGNGQTNGTTEGRINNDIIGRVL